MVYSEVSLVVAILITVMMCGQSFQQSNQAGFSLDRLIQGARYKRSFFGTGVKTVPKLLKTAEEFSSDAYRRTYRKFGNYQTAMDDFHSLKPSNIHTGKMGNGIVGTEGTVGGNKIYVYEGGLMDRAILDIIPVFGKKDGIRPPIETIHYNL